MKEKLILSNKEEIEIEVASSITDIRVVSQTKADMIAVWDKLTDSNLQSVVVRNEDGVIVSTYENLVFVNEKSEIQEDGKIRTSFNLRKKTELEMLREEVNALKVDKEVQDGAIAGLGEAVSNLAEIGGNV